MEAKHIKAAIREALKGGNWLAFNQGAAMKNQEFCFFFSKEDAKECCYNNTSDRDRRKIHASNRLLHQNETELREAKTGIKRTGDKKRNKHSKRNVES